MAFFISSTKRDRQVFLSADRLHLRLPQLHDYEEWAALRRQSEDFLQPWEPVWGKQELTQRGFKKRVKYYQRGMKEGSAYALFLYDRQGDRLLGGVTLSNIRYGVIGSCALGYWIGAPFVRQGFMTEAVGAVSPFAFDRLRLHRLEAACLTSNKASIALLRKCGFRREGVARKYLRINGEWRDHLLFAMLEEDYAANCL